MGLQRIPAERETAESSAAPDSPLSDLEIRVLTLSALGQTDTCIANGLKFSIGSVRYAARNAITKLGAANRTHAVALAVAAGIVDVA